MAAAEETVTADIGSRSIRDELLAAQEEVNAREEPVEEIKSERPRDDSGRFARTAQPEAEEPAATPEKSPTVQADTPPPAEAPIEAKKPKEEGFVPAPQSWSNQEKALWQTVPAEARKAILRREQDVHRALTAQDEERALARQFRQVSQPYEALIQAQGGNPMTAYQEFLKTAYTLYTADPQTKARMLQDVAQRHGIPLDGSASPAPVAQVPPQFLQELNATRQQVAAMQQAQQQAQMQQTMSEIEQFQSDPANKYFDAVRDHMAALITAGTAQSLKDAYDQAVWARPDIRSQLIAEQTAPLTGTIQARQKTDKARGKAVSVRGGAGGSPEVANPNRSLRDELSAAFEEARGRI